MIIKHFSFAVILMIGLLSCCLALLINRYAGKRIIISFAGIFLLFFIIELVSSFFISVKKNEEMVYNLNNVFLRKKISADFAFNLSGMSRLITYKGQYYGGVLRKYDAIDLLLIFPEMKEVYSKNEVTIWTYDLYPEKIIRDGHVLEIIGRKIESGTLFFFNIPCNIVENSSILYCVKE